MENFGMRELSAEDIDHVVRDMDREGYARIAKFFPDEMVGEARQFVTGELEKPCARIFLLYRARSGARLHPRGYRRLGHVRNLLARVYERGTGKQRPESGVYQVLRVLSGRSGLKEAFQFHYDAYVVTALMPIAIPTGPGEKRGDLMIYPKLRGIRSNVVVNLVEKILLQNKLARRIARSAFMQRILKAKVLRMEPGDIYLFWGYQSLHGNEPCFPTSTRATALFHFADPHEESPVVTRHPALAQPARAQDPRARRLPGRARAHEAAGGGANRPRPVRARPRLLVLWAKPLSPKVRHWRSSRPRSRVASISSTQAPAMAPGTPSGGSASSCGTITPTES